MRSYLTLYLLLLAACAESKTGVPSPPTKYPLTVWNTTQRPLEEVRVHDGAEYFNARNLLGAPLADDERTVVDILSGQRVTVIRRNVDGGQRIAFTTASGLFITGPGYVLQVFQESFRLLEPEPTDGGPPDGGDPAPDGSGDSVFDGDPMPDGDGGTGGDGGDA